MIGDRPACLVGDVDANTPNIAPDVSFPVCSAGCCDGVAASVTGLPDDPAVMLLDEPTQGMGLEDVDRIRRLIKQVSADRTILMVEHNMSVVSSIADTITVLQRGATLAEGPYEQVSKNPAVIEAYMGSASVELKGAH